VKILTEVRDMKERGLIITLASGGKGGVSKSANAVNLASGFANRGLKVGLVDTDTGLAEQGSAGTRSASKWCAARDFLINQGEALPPISSYMLSPEEKIQKQLLELAQINDVTILDTPGDATTALRSALPVSDVILLPINCTRGEFLPLTEFFNLISDMEDLMESSGMELTIDARILPSRIPGNWRMDNSEFMEWYTKTASRFASLSGVAIPFVKAIAESVGEGWGLHDIKHDKRGEFDRLMDEIVGKRAVRCARIRG
jgi:cellulose biosynthesis protein BcsQ